MREPVLLSQYRPPSWRVDAVELVFDLDFAVTDVAATLHVRRATDDPDAPLVLDGEGLDLLAIAIDGAPLPLETLVRDAAGALVLAIARDTAVVTTHVRLRPDANTALEGLYRSGRFLLTQCEAQGFRRITYFPDRPDVMARYRVELRADRTRFPVLLANGNPAGTRTLPDGRHAATWDDPFPKPSYLFAIAAGDLAVTRATFRTMSGRDVALAIWAEADAISRCAHAMASVVASMRWDEQRYGREYDLDAFNIVATHDFNMGAMENKGLNIFNAKYIVADVDTATDDDFEHVAAVVAHEYFHNWTGNRMTCRDWFQLSLKEGLTVFRDQQFSADQGSPAVRRIDAVRQLRSIQFAEDAGPFAHPVRPDRYVEINNFYTSTVYEKGAEIIRMMHTVLGPERFRRGMDLYFDRHDGQAVTCDDYRRALSDGGGIDLEPFARWYTQAGTPQLRADGVHDPSARTFSLTLRQSTPPTPGQPDKLPVPIPVRLMLYGRDGAPLPLHLADDEGAATNVPTQRVIVFADAERTYVFTGIDAPPVASLLQDFSAPVTLHHARGDGDLAFLARHDRDPFNRWQAMQSLAEEAITATLAAGNARGAAIDALVHATGALFDDATLDAGFIAECLALPDEGYLADRFDIGDPQALHDARRAVQAALGDRLGEPMRRVVDDTARDDGAARDGRAIGRRRLRNVVLSLLMFADPARHDARVRAQYDGARNMTDRLAALTRLVHHDRDDAHALADGFRERYRDDPLVLDKWLALQASNPSPGTLARVVALTAHPVFSWKNPNKVRALIGTFARGNRVAFHAPGGEGYRFVGDAVAMLDGINPQIAARLVAAFNGWRRIEPIRRAAMRTELDRLAARPGLSPDVGEIVSRALA